MNKIKKVFSVIVLVAMIMTQMTGLVYASDTDKLEPKIVVGGGVPGKLSDGTRVPSLGTTKEAGSVIEIFANDDATGASGIKQVGYSWDSNDVNNFKNLPGYYRVYTNTPNTLGAHKLYVYAIDKAGNMKSATYTFNLERSVWDGTLKGYTYVNDKTNPTVSFSKASGSICNANEVITITVNDSNLVKFNYVVTSPDGSINGSNEFRNVNKATVVLGTAPGKYKISVSAIDKALNEGSGSITYTVKDNTPPPTPDTTRPTMAINGPNPYSILSGESVKYTVQYNDNKGISNILLNSNYIRLNGFTADINVTDGGSNTKIVTLNNVQGAIGGNKSITILEGSAVDAAGNKTTAGNSNPFETRKKEEPPKPTPDTTRPTISIYGPNPYSILKGETVRYTVQYSDNEGIANILLNKNYIKLNGFTANINITDGGKNTKIVTLNNVQGAIGDNKSITILEGSAVDAAGNKTAAGNSNAFEIRRKEDPPKPNPDPDPEPKPNPDPIVPRPKPTPRPQPVAPTIVNTCVDDGMLGDINNEITYFATWLRAEKYTATNVQENNYAAKGETMTYMVEYYNGSTAPTPNVYFTLTIPKYTEVEEINGNGKIVEQTDQTTVIRWELGEIKNGEKCRLYVRVKFNEDTALENSKQISEEFYSHLETNADGNIGHSYMRQLFIDKNENKRGTYTKYLSALDATNSIRPDDKITRAEFAKLLADSGIITVAPNSDKYKQYKDEKDIPEWAKDAVSALIGTDIMQSYSDSTFKPNNPIIREEMMQMIAQASRYKSKTLLTISKPVFLYTAKLKTAAGNISDKKDYIMELMRQNIVVKYESRPDEYATRSEVVDIINALTNRGPFVEKLPDNTMKFADIQGHKFFYGIIGASNTYEYKYDYRLWQEITAIK